MAAIIAPIVQSTKRQALGLASQGEGVAPLKASRPNQSTDALLAPTRRRKIAPLFERLIPESIKNVLLKEVHARRVVRLQSNWATANTRLNSVHEVLGSTTEILPYSTSWSLRS